MLISMFGLNWVDLVIVISLLLFTLQGVRLGFLAQAFSLAGFFGTLFLAGWIFPQLLDIDNQPLRTSLNATLVLLAAVTAGLVCLSVGHNIHWSFKIGKLQDKQKLRIIESSLGGLTAFVGTLIAVWLVGIGISRLPFEGLSNSVSDAKIVQQLTEHMPPMPAVFAQIDKQIDPNAPPFVTAQPEPQASFEYSEADVKTATAKGNRSLVRITSFGCGGLISGSGFVAGPNLVATNAHVIAGVKRPIIKYGDHSYAGVPVFFNPSLDIAVLRTENLDAPALPFANTTVPDDTTVAVLGFPGGNYRAAPGIIRQTLNIAAPNIYSFGSFTREAYAIQAKVDQGSSGGPVVLPNGHAAGMIFSESTDTPDYGYAITAAQVAAAVEQAKSTKWRVNTGACTLH